MKSCLLAVDVAPHTGKIICLDVFERGENLLHNGIYTLNI